MEPFRKSLRSVLGPQESITRLQGPSRTAEPLGTDGELEGLWKGAALASPRRFRCSPLNRFRAVRRVKRPDLKVFRVFEIKTSSSLHRCFDALIRARKGNRLFLNPVLENEKSPIAQWLHD